MVALSFKLLSRAELMECSPVLMIATLMAKNTNTLAIPKIIDNLVLMEERFRFFSTPIPFFILFFPP